jgi:hypothetical protein
MFRRKISLPSSGSLRQPEEGDEIRDPASDNLFRYIPFLLWNPRGQYDLLKSLALDRILSSMRQSTSS